MLVQLNSVVIEMLHCIVPFLSCLTVLLPSLAFSSAKPEQCSPSCGSLDIPYPFGIGPSCSLNPSFDIHCNTSKNPPKAFFSATNLEIVALNESQIWVKYPNLALACYGLSGNATERSDLKINLSSTPFTLSEENWLTAVGCDDFVTVVGTSNTTFGSGCLSFCSGNNVYGYWQDDGNGNPKSKGCCRTLIPSGTKFLSAYLSDSHRNWRENKLFPCSYAFISEKNNDLRNGASQFSYRFNGLHNSTAFLNGNPKIKETRLVLDWTVGNESCTLAQMNPSTYACRANKSFCIEVQPNYKGYRCGCEYGYRGNPYQVDGCKEVDECHPEYRGTRRCGGFNGPIRDVVIILGFSIVFLLVLSILCWLNQLYLRRSSKHQKEKFFVRNGGLLLQQQTSRGTLGNAKFFTAKELEKATDNFNERRILGQGGQGTVYKGMLPNGQIVAIKKAKKISIDQLEEFINEVVILSQINHRNVLKLLGFCLETEVPLLVYEFARNGTLFDLIHDPNREFPVSWNMRLKFAADIAFALAYLHSATSLPIYHRDIKTSNILLDEKYIVKVSDFGTSKSVTVDQTHVTTQVKGTFGYLDPEYFRSGQYTEKSDVYSFAVVVVELLTRQRVVSSNEDVGLAARFLEAMEMGRLDKILDDQVLGEGRKEEVVAVARLAQRCLNLQGRMRPTMKEVVTELESIRMSRTPAASSNEDQGVHEEDRFDEDKMMMISDFEYSWMTSGIKAASSSSSSSDSRPLKFETM